ncbi:MAG: hypothetical protein EON56_04650 [Alphaproteobacteria bacterium]|nr:MAG: hypothetical protein EON56_04650 [Alphaproteobacteria bacterium]
MNMQLPSRRYYYLDEVAAAWNVQIRDLLDFAVGGALRCSTLVNNIRVQRLKESGAADEECISGLQGIVAQDLIEVIRTGVTSVRQLRDQHDRVLAFTSDQVDLDVALEHIMVTREDRARFEAVAGGEAAQQTLAPATFKHRADYYEVTLSGKTYTFGPAQAGVVRKLHEAFLAGEPWCPKGYLTEQTGGQRLVDLFKRKKDPSWRDLIVSDGRGRWRLNLDPSEPLASNRAYRRVVRMFRKMHGSTTISIP